MTYAFEVVGQLNSGVNEVLVKARGRAISRAVDVAEVVRRHRLMEGTVTIGSVSIGTERLTNREGKDLNVSFIQITLTRRPPTGEPAPAPSPPTTGATGSRPPSPP
jgi:DNA-binding protein